MSRIRHFRFEVDVDYHATQHRRMNSILDAFPVEYRVLSLSVEVDGETIVHRQPMTDTQMSFETEIEFYTRSAVAALHQILKGREAAKDV